MEYQITKKGKFYLVKGVKDTYRVNLDLPFCDCPHFIFRVIKAGGKCKHIKAVEEFLKNKKLNKEIKNFKPHDKDSSNQKG